MALAFSAATRPLHAHPTQSSIARHLGESKYIGLLNELRDRHGFHAKELETLFRKAQLHPEIVNRYDLPRERLPYPQYRNLFLTDSLIGMGREYMRTHQSVLERVELQYGVDSWVIAAILGVESKFGRQPDGGFRVFDALNTAFAAIPRREAFARKELVEYLLLCREENFDFLSIKGSYAGAMGTPQFIPSSYRRYAVDHDQDGKRDLWRSQRDILASVANYLRIHGWQKGAPIRSFSTTQEENPGLRQLLEQGLKGKTRTEELARMGMEWAGSPPPPEISQEVSLIRHPTEDARGIAILYPNFRVLLRYNPSTNYALVVADCAEALARAMA